MSFSWQKHVTERQVSKIFWGTYLSLAWLAGVPTVGVTERSVAWNVEACIVYTQSSILQFSISQWGLHIVSQPNPAKQGGHTRGVKSGWGWWGICPTTFWPKFAKKICFFSTSYSTHRNIGLFGIKMMGIEFSFRLSDIFFGGSITLRSTLLLIYRMTFHALKMHQNASQHISSLIFFFYIYRLLSTFWPLLGHPSFESNNNYYHRVSFLVAKSLTG